MKFFKDVSLLLLIMLFCFSCGSGGAGGGGSRDGEGAPAGGEAEVIETATYQFGNNIIQKTAYLGPSGGTIEGEAGSPIEGVTVDFPAGALGSEVKVHLGYNTGSLKVITGQHSGVNLYLDVEGVEEFPEPVSITIPFSFENSVPVPYYVSPDGELNLMTLTELDEEKGTATFISMHNSVMTWLKHELGVPYHGEYETGFEPAADGFQIVNYGSDYNRGGECLGMTAFSLWYYRAHLSDGKFFPRFMGKVGADSKGYDIRVQDVIATRAFISVDQYWGYNLRKMPQVAIPDVMVFGVIANALINTGHPVLLALAKEYPQIGGHSVLAYGYDWVNGFIKVYDPNIPGDGRVVFYDRSTNDFKAYEGLYTQVYYAGDGSLRIREPFGKIYEDALENFQSSDKATIIVESHWSGTKIQQTEVEIFGTVDSSQVLVDELIVLVNSTRYKASLDDEGNWEATIRIKEGDNYLQFITSGKDFHNYRIMLPNNMWTEDFLLTGEYPSKKCSVDIDRLQIFYPGETERQSWGWWSEAHTIEFSSIDDETGYSIYKGNWDETRPYEDISSYHSQGEMTVWFDQEYITYFSLKDKKTDSYFKGPYAGKSSEQDIVFEGKDFYGISDEYGSSAMGAMGEDTCDRITELSSSSATIYGDVATYSDPTCNDMSGIYVQCR